MGMLALCNPAHPQSARMDRVPDTPTRHHAFPCLKRETWESMIVRIPGDGRDLLGEGGGAGGDVAERDVVDDFAGGVAGEFDLFGFGAVFADAAEDVVALWLEELDAVGGVGGGED